MLAHVMEAVEEFAPLLKRYLSEASIPPKLRAHARGQLLSYHLYYVTKQHLSRPINLYDMKAFMRGAMFREYHLYNTTAISTAHRFLRLFASAQDYDIDIYNFDISLHILQSKVGAYVKEDPLSRGLLCFRHECESKGLVTS